MSREPVHDDGRQWDHPDAGRSLGRSKERHPSRDAHELAIDRQSASQEIDPIQRQTEYLTLAHPGPHSEKDEAPVTLRHGLHERSNLLQIHFSADDSLVTGFQTWGATPGLPQPNSRYVVLLDNETRALLGIVPYEGLSPLRVEV